MNSEKFNEFIGIYYLLNRIDFLLDNFFTSFFNKFSALLLCNTCNTMQCLTSLIGIIFFINFCRSAQY